MPAADEEARTAAGGVQSDNGVRFKSRVAGGREVRIGELARRTGVSERSLRYYEQQGLLVSQRTPGGHRDFPDTAFDRVIRIQELFAAGLNSTRIAKLLPCMRDVDGGPSEIATPKLVSDLTAERDRISGMIDDLVRSRDVLDEVIDTAAGQRP